MSSGIGVERIFPVNSPLIDKIEVNKKGKVRRSRIFYLRNLTGKSAELKKKDNLLIYITFKIPFLVMGFFSL